MPLTREFKETVQARARRDPAFRAALLQEAIDCMLAGDTETGKLVLRDYINATVGFDELGAATHKSPKSLSECWRPAATRRPTTSSPSWPTFRRAKASA